MRFSASSTILSRTANPTMPPQAVTVWHSRSPDETRSLARGLAAAFLREGAVVSLTGPLGAGKTEFAKGLAEGFGLAPAALASPTFTIASEVPLGAGGPRRLVHADWFRVGSEEELEAAGLEDWLGSDAVLVVEWADRFPEALGRGALDVRFEETAPSERRLTASADGPAAAALLARWEQRCR
jgi:tRNA threonylcarbamoyladenosine biosynthesis protein TsaE